jgi:hypothetical protein
MAGDTYDIGLPFQMISYAVLIHSCITVFELDPETRIHPTHRARQVRYDNIEKAHFVFLSPE